MPVVVMLLQCSEHSFPAVRSPVSRLLETWDVHIRLGAKLFWRKKQWGNKSSSSQNMHQTCGWLLSSPGTIHALLQFLSVQTLPGIPSTASPLPSLPQTPWLIVPTHSLRPRPDIKSAVCPPWCLRLFGWVLFNTHSVPTAGRAPGRWWRHNGYKWANSASPSMCQDDTASWLCLFIISSNLIESPHHCVLWQLKIFN